MFQPRHFGIVFAGLLLMLTSGVLLAACSDSTGPEGPISVDISMPVAVVGEPLFAGLFVCEVPTTLHATGSGSGSWEGATITGAHTGSEQISVADLVDLFGTNRITPGRDYTMPVFRHGEPPLTIELTMRYSTAGEIRSVRAESRCQAP